MSENLDEAWLQTFRKHRHDVLNGLQLAQGYVQMNQPEKALRSIRELSVWLHSLSLFQSILDEKEFLLFRTAASSPHITLKSFQRHRPLEVCEVEQLSGLWAELEETASELGVKSVEVALESLNCRPIKVEVFGMQGFTESVQARDELSVVFSNLDENTISREGIRLGNS